MSKYHLSPDAKADLREIWNYRSRRNPEGADALLDELHAQFDTIVANPEIGRERDNLARGLRCLIYGEYLIFYWSYTRPLEISRIIHGVRDLSKIVFE